MSRHSFTRQELYDRVWVEPMSKICKDLGVSDRGLAKACARANIPVPPRGYWARKDAGQEVPVAPLPPLKTGERDQVIIDPQVFACPPQAPKPLEATPEERIPVPAELHKPHPITVTLRQQLKSKNPDDYNMLLSSGPGLFALRLGPDSVDRGLRILDALIKACIHRGFPLHLKADKPAQFDVNGELFTISIEDSSQRSAHRLTDQEKRDKARGHGWGIPLYDYIPRGKLTLKIDHGFNQPSRGTFTDGAKLKLEDLLHEILVSLLENSNARKAEKVRQKNREQRLAEENARRAEVRKQQDLESKKLKKLETDARDWTLAMHMRGYLADLETKKSEEGADLSPEGELGQYLTWARQQADRLDPLTSSPASVLDEERPEELKYWQVRWEDD